MSFLPTYWNRHQPGAAQRRRRSTKDPVAARGLESELAGWVLLGQLSHFLVEEGDGGLVAMVISLCARSLAFLLMGCSVALMSKEATHGFRLALLDRLLFFFCGLLFADGVH